MTGSVQQPGELAQMLLGVKLIHERQMNERICDARLQPEAEDKKPALGAEFRSEVAEEQRFRQP
ncbi:MAG: hypothetical protein KJZ78_08600 [Bryobacteraceae bacterium]|nr:hypothetical protein [Bryobacteraceae bacterium]